MDELINYAKVTLVGMILIFVMSLLIFSTIVLNTMLE